MNEYESRYKSVRFIWSVLLIMFLAVIGSTLFTGGLGLGHGILAFSLLMVGIIATSELSGGSKSTIPNAITDEKSKRDDSLDSLISRLSEDERAHLRDTLSDGRTGYGLADDGELVQKRIR